MAWDVKEQCFFCGNEVDRKDGEFIEVDTPVQDANNSGMKIMLARWACNDCIAEYKRYVNDGKC